MVLHLRVQPMNKMWKDNAIRFEKSLVHTVDFRTNRQKENGLSMNIHEDVNIL